MTEVQAIIIRTWISTYEEAHNAKQYKVQDVRAFKQEEQEHTNIEKAMHKRCLDAMTCGLQGRLRNRPAKENRFDIEEKGRFGWVTYGDIFLWCKQQHKLESEEAEEWTEEMFWNMILHTQNFVTKRYVYNVKYWPNIGMVMIKVAMEDEEKAEDEVDKYQENAKKRLWSEQNDQEGKAASSRG
eukprot:3119514-Heterocapsa_arctica.AAC.1